VKVNVNSDSNAFYATIQCPTEGRQFIVEHELGVKPCVLPMFPSQSKNDKILNFLIANTWANPKGQSVETYIVDT
jgi:hypothetical protein